MCKISVEVHVYCTCGEHLCNQSKAGTAGRGIPCITVEPCQRCLQRARDEGYDMGYESGYASGVAEGRDE